VNDIGLNCLNNNEDLATNGACDFCIQDIAKEFMFSMSLVAKESTNEAGLGVLIQHYTY
jgi:hypothetical protein